MGRAPETIEEAKARMGTPPSAPGSESPLTDEDLARVEREATEWATRGFPLFAVTTSQLVAEVRRLRAPLSSEDLQATVDVVRRAIESDGWPGDDWRATMDRLEAELLRLRFDDWLKAAAEEITETQVREGYVEEAAVVAILRKHRDGR